MRTKETRLKSHKEHISSNLLINKIVHIVGAGMEQTIIDGQNSRVIYIDVPPICQLYISNLKLTNGSK